MCLKQLSGLKEGSLLIEIKKYFLPLMHLLLIQNKTYVFTCFKFKNETGIKGG